jgi:hypothetical protein
LIDILRTQREVGRVRSLSLGRGKVRICSSITPRLKSRFGRVIGIGTYMLFRALHSLALFSLMYLYKGT